MTGAAAVTLCTSRPGGTIEVSVSRRTAERSGIASLDGWTPEAQEEMRRYDATRARHEREYLRHNVSFTDAKVNPAGQHTPKPESRPSRGKPAADDRFATPRQAAFWASVGRDNGRAFESPERFVVVGGLMPCEPARRYSEWWEEVE